MAKLFKDRIIKEKIQNLVIPDFEYKIKIAQGWLNAFKDGSLQKKTETQCEQAFNNDFFVKILDYVAFPSITYTIQPKDSVEIGGGQKPDATLGFYKDNIKRTIAVVEIKDANTSLDKAQYRMGGLTPIQQGFKYKPQYKECNFVIVTNFREIRIYRDNQLDFEKFTLNELLDSKNDYFQFKKLYLLLNSSNFIVEKGQTETERLLSAIRIEQEKISYDFYKDYKKLRSDLIRDIVNNNQIKRSDFYNLAVEKAQKIVDRIVFICFFEDCGLLPENKLYEVIEYSQKGQLEEPIWDIIKKFFKAIDEGSPKLGIPDGYNGELFKKDEVLDSLTISDPICQHFVNLSKYDFDEDLSVNILGHIFEQSIVDLERLRNYSKGGDDILEGKESKRKKEGIYYTPEYIVNYILKESLGRYLNNKEVEIFAKYKLDVKSSKKEAVYVKKTLSAYLEYQDFLRNVRILDPACGSGSFLVGTFDYLLNENKRISDIISELQGNASLFDYDSYVRGVLQNNIYGVDLNNESVEIAKLSLWLKSAKKGEKLTTLKENIRCGNSLIEDPLIAKNKAFIWEKEFASIMSNGGFDVVIGNPPYVDSETMTKEDPLSREYLSNKYASAKGNWDLYVPFIEKARSLTKKEGFTAMIVPNKWLSIDYGKALREIIANEVYMIADFSNVKVFEDANISSVIFSLTNKQSDDLVVEKFTSSDQSIKFVRNTNLKREDNWGTVLLEDFDLIKKIEEKSVPLKSVATVSGAFTTSEAYELVKVVNDINISSSDYYKLINTGTIDKYLNKWGIDLTAYLGKKYKFPVVSRNKFKDLFPKRFNKFNKPKIIVSGIRHFECYLDVNNYYLAGKSTSVITDVEASLTIEALTAILNSRLIGYFLKRKYWMSGMGGGISFTPDIIRNIPLKISRASKSQIDSLGQLSLQIQIISEEYMDLILKLIKLLHHELEIAENNEKFKKLYPIDLEEMLKLSKKSLSIDEKSKLYDFIKTTNNEIVIKMQKVNELKENIDNIVYLLYDTNENDVKVMKNETL